jgi:hypothetical protein
MLNLVANYADNLILYGFKKIKNPLVNCWRMRILLLVISPPSMKP